MLFNSYIFLFAFLPLTWIAFRLLSGFSLTRIAIGALVLASLVFYSYWNPPFVLLILFSIGFNFGAGKLLSSSRKRSRLKLATGIGINLGLIAYFKYTGFLVENGADLFGADWKAPDIFLPLGISFFTFQQIAYLVDCHRGIAKEHSFLHYCLFVTFFPQLIAGPIVHHGDVMPQFSRESTFRFSAANTATGLATLVLGLFKKVIIADTLSPWVAALFDAKSGAQLYGAWIGSLAYTFQIYFDFSGYSDMAIGLGKLFNIDLPVNFDSPYKATSIADFWRRWHMTLSKFLKDYLYIPLGGNRKGSVRRYVNLMITMLLGGLWHGAAWTFVVWGGIHGILLSINHGFRRLTRDTRLSIPRPVGWALTFVPVVFAWVFFRAATFDRATEIIKGMIGLNGFEGLGETVLQTEGNSLEFLPFDERLALLGALLLVCLLLPTSWHWARTRLERWPVLSAVSIGALFVVSVMGMTRISEFLYFQF